MHKPSRSTSLPRLRSLLLRCRAREDVEAAMPLLRTAGRPSPLHASPHSLEEMGAAAPLLLRAIVGGGAATHHRRMEEPLLVSNNWSPVPTVPSERESSRSSSLVERVAPLGRERCGGGAAPLGGSGAGRARSGGGACEAERAREERSRIQDRSRDGRVYHSTVGNRKNRENRKKMEKEKKKKMEKECAWEMSVWEKRRKKR